MANNLKAIGLISGGLDSSLAIKAIQLQGIEVIALHYLIPFVKYDATSGIEESSAKKIANSLSCKLKIIELRGNYLKMIKNPKYGYGKNLNPCIDCKIFMLKHAKKIMQQQGAKFVFTGEVVGQRPMSQNKKSLAKIEKESGLGKILVRPLSAMILPKTIPQKEGWLKSEFLFDINGRGRKRQIALAKKWAIKEYPWPGGGCLLTDPSFCRRLKDIMDHEEYSLDNIKLLKVGRHFRINKKLKLVVGRDQKDNERILDLARNSDVCFEPDGIPGPIGIGRGILDKDTKRIAAQIVARYTSLDDEIKVTFGFIGRNKKEIILEKAINENRLKSFMV